MLPCFNPSVGILSVQTSRPAGPGQQQAEFQSLGRDSERSNGCPAPAQEKNMPCFNPSVGILSVQTSILRRQQTQNRQFQSLGRDSGCSSRRLAGGCSLWLRRFNPSVGILGVQAPYPRWASRRNCRFQSLGRDSGCSSTVSVYAVSRGPAVSIPRSGFWVFKLPASKPTTQKGAVSIPRSGFWVFKLGQSSAPRVGLVRFQSLGRDSGCSSWLSHQCRA